MHGEIRKRKSPIVAFDVDGTLFDYEGNPRHGMIDILRGFHNLGWHVWIWSGGGKDYCDHVVRRLGLQEFVSFTLGKVDAPNYATPALAFDDVYGTDLAKAMVFDTPDQGTETIWVAYEANPEDHPERQEIPS